MQTTHPHLVEPPIDEVGVSLRDIERMLSAATAAALVAYGLSRRSAFGLVVAAAATPFAYRGLSDRWPFVESGDEVDTRSALSGKRGVHVRESIRIERPLPEIYRFWRRFENLPQFMSHLDEVIDQGNGLSHWVAKGPGGVRVAWDAEIINEVENKVIGWRSLPDSDVVTAGSVNFDEVRGGRSTQLSVNLQYSPPAGKFGAVTAMLFGAEPSQTIREDLRRLKQLLEAGEIPRATPDGLDDPDTTIGSWR
jgi:uncharacterized membrane protein